MEISLDTILAIAGLFVGGGGGAFFTWRWQRAKAKAEAQTAEVNMAKEVQSTYQEILRSKQEEVDDKNRIIAELRQDRDHFRQDRNELRERIDKMDERVRDLQAQVARNGRQLECMRPLLCGRRHCPDRISVTISADGEVRPSKVKNKTGKKNDKTEQELYAGGTDEQCDSEEDGNQK